MQRASPAPGRARARSCCACRPQASRSPFCETAITWPSGSARRVGWRRRMARALLVVGLAAPLIAVSWMRLEHGHDTGQATVVILLALVPALLRGWWRVAAAIVAALAAGAVAFGSAPVWELPGRILGHFGSGFLQFYDVQI